MSQPAKAFEDVETCVDWVIDQVGTDIRLATPLGLGKCTPLLNAFYRRACRNPGLELTIFTALSLETPKATGPLEARLLEPIIEREYADYEELDYLKALHEGKLPKNVTVSEFFFLTGMLLGNRHAQRHYRSSNYTHVARDLLDAGINVMAQMISKKRIDGDTRYSLSCNTDVTLEILDRLDEIRAGNRKLLVIGQVNARLPFMHREAIVPATDVDAIVDDPKDYAEPFATPNAAISTADYMIGLHASALIRDGGTIQIGIGSLGDALAYSTILRQRRNADYRQLLEETGAFSKFGDSIDRLGGSEPFDTGLYGSTEMLVDAYAQLYKAGILKRKVYDDLTVQRLLHQGRITEKVNEATLDALLEAGAIRPRLGEAEVEYLKRTGVFRADLFWQEGRICVRGAAPLAADLDDPNSRRQILANCLGERLRGGTVVHGGFFLGPRHFYEFLRGLSDAEHQQFCMTSVFNVNQLYRNEELKTLQRQHARFFNTGMMATLTGAVVSDGFEDGQVLSGVGGQYNFVTMAHALPGARSVIMVRSVRDADSGPVSNLVWNYGHITIPRHLRDIVVTEYGIAYLRGCTDEQVITRLIEIADSRFQAELLKTAKQAGKVAADYKIPEPFRHNTPQRLEAVAQRARNKDLLPKFPFGSAFTEEEVILTESLKALQKQARRKTKLLPRPGEWTKLFSPPPAAQRFLERMDLTAPQGWGERKQRWTVLLALARAGHI